MALTITEASQAFPEGAITSDRRLFLSSDEETVVEEGDARARFLLCSPGAQIPASTVKRLGLEVVDGVVSIKQAEKTADKNRTAHEDKGRKGRGN